jgi:hypothetical protein
MINKICKMKEFKNEKKKKYDKGKIIYEIWIFKNLKNLLTKFFVRIITKIKF